MRPASSFFAFLAPFALAATTPLPAQTATIPSGYLKTEGNGSFGPPWYFTNARSLSLYEGKRVPAALRSIRGLRIRPDGKISRGLSKVLTVEVAMSNKGVVASIPPFYSTWSRHYGTDRRIAMRRRRITLPAVTSAAPNPPNPWSKGFTLPFDAPWYRTGTVNDALCIDIKTWTPKTLSAQWYSDAEAVGRFGLSSTVGKACPSTATYWVGGQYLGSQYGLYSAAYTLGSGDLCIAWIGSSHNTIPFGSYRGQACTLYTLPQIIHPRLITSTGSRGYASRWVWLNPIPAQLVGVWFRTQMAAIATRYGNALKLMNAVDVQIGPGIKGSYRQGTVLGYAYGVVSFNPDTSPAKYMSNQVLIFGVY